LKEIPEREDLSFDFCEGLCSFFFLLWGKSFYYLLRRVVMAGYEKEFRIEKDVIGEKNILKDAYYGIHTARALDNFPVSGRTTNKHMIEAIVLVKKAAAIAHRNLDHMPKEVVEAIISACDDILCGKLINQFVVDAFQGGAGTSTNMNANEVIANRAIELLG
jgi:aspartate ammonia-lyase